MNRVLTCLLVWLSFSCETWYHQLWSIDNDREYDIVYNVYLESRDSTSTLLLVENDTLKGYSNRIFTNYFDLGYSGYTVDTMEGDKKLMDIRIGDYNHGNDKAYLLKGIKRQLRQKNHPVIIVQWQELGKQEIHEKRIFYPQQKKGCTHLLLPDGTYLW